MQRRSPADLAILSQMLQAVVFDLDGVLLDSEQRWDEARRTVVEATGGRWREGATAAMQGMSSQEWSEYLHDELAVPLGPHEIVGRVVAVLLDAYKQALPAAEGAAAALERIGRRWPLALASSANRQVIEEVLLLSGWSTRFRVTVSADEVARGKPAPDVYLEAARRLIEPADSCAAIEDSANGIRSALAARLAVVALPNRDYPPPAQLLGRADKVVENLDGVTVELLEELGSDRDSRREHRLDEEEAESFPASDPHSDWAGPP
jgi:HAD superfamily hydrolase (TIGR01509 family)